MAAASPRGPARQPRSRPWWRRTPCSGPSRSWRGSTVVRKGATVGPFARAGGQRDRPRRAGPRPLPPPGVRGGGGRVRRPLRAPPAREPQSGPRAKVGNFVELKKTHLGEGSKAPHLSYLGDATIGPGVNVGRGHHHLQLRRRPQAPHADRGGGVRREQHHARGPGRGGGGAYVAAGSAITEDVPAGALALGRARQVVKSGWARRSARKHETPRGPKG